MGPYVYPSLVLGGWVYSKHICALISFIGDVARHEYIYHTCIEKHRIPQPCIKGHTIPFEFPPGACKLTSLLPWCKLMIHIMYKNYSSAYYVPKAGTWLIHLGVCTYIPTYIHTISFQLLIQKYQIWDSEVLWRMIS